MTMSTRLLGTILIVATVLAGCSSGDAGDSFETAETMATETTSAAGGGSPEATVADDTADGETVAMSDLPERKVIQTATISIESDDTRASMAAIEELVEDSGGFVQSADVRETGSETDQPTIDLVLRIPVDDLPGAVEAVADLGTRVISQTQRGQDVTDEYVDVEARLENLRLLETELRELLEDVRGQADTDPAKLLQVFDEISRVRGEIERLEGRRQVLDDLTSLATLEVSITPTAVSAPVVEEGWSPLAVLRESLRSLIAAGQWIVDAGIRAIVLVAPLLLVLVVLPGLAGRALWRRFGRPSSTTAEPAAE